jgi:hypothetical protein
MAQNDNKHRMVLYLRGIPFDQKIELFDKFDSPYRDTLACELERKLID